MDIPTFYRYLAQARRDLWTALEAMPDEALSRKVIPGERFHSIKDLVFHVPSVEDGWLHGDIQRAPLLVESLPELYAGAHGPNFGTFPLATLLDYWRGVEEATLAYLERLTPAELRRSVVVEDVEGAPACTVESLLWHVMQHEARHTAQIALLMRQQGVRPPSLDLLFYLPVE